MNNVLNPLETIVAVIAIVGGSAALVKYITSRSMPLSSKDLKELLMVISVSFILLVIAYALLPLFDSSPKSDASKSPISSKPVLITPTPTPTPTPTATPTPTPTAVQEVLCSPNLSNGLNGWSATSDWNIGSGNLQNDGTNSSDLGTSPSLLVPCDLHGTTNYVLIATIQVGTQGYDPGFGFFVSYNSSDQGYIAGVNDDFNASNPLSHFSVSNVSNFYQPLDNVAINNANTLFNGSQHIYRIEVHSNYMQVIIDGNPLLLVDTNSASGNSIGLWDKDVQLKITSLSVKALK